MEMMLLRSSSELAPMFPASSDSALDWSGLGVLGVWHCAVQVGWPRVASESLSRGLEVLMPSSAADAVKMA